MLRPFSFALAGGVFNGAWMFIFTWIAIWWGYGREWMEMMEPGYPGYAVTYGGSIIGAIWGFVYWFIGFYIFAWLYNLFGKCCEKS